MTQDSNESLLQLAKAAGYNPAMLSSDHQYSALLKEYVAVTLNYRGTNESKTVPDIYSDRLTLLRAFYSEYKKSVSEDSGIEQQISDLMVEISNKIPDFDWSKYSPS